MHNSRLHIIALLCSISPAFAVKTDIYPDDADISVPNKAEEPKGAKREQDQKAENVVDTNPVSNTEANADSQKENTEVLEEPNGTKRDQAPKGKNVVDENPASNEEVDDDPQKENTEVLEKPNGLQPEQNQNAANVVDTNPVSEEEANADHQKANTKVLEEPNGVPPEQNQNAKNIVGKNPVSEEEANADHQKENTEGLDGPNGIPPEQDQNEENVVDKNPVSNKKVDDALREEFFQAFWKFKEQQESEKKKSQTQQEIIDKNFENIEKVRDDLQKEFEGMREIFRKCPADLKMAFKLMADVISGYWVMFQEKGVIEPVEKAVSAVVETYDDINPKIQEILILLQIFDIITSNSSSIIEILKKRNSTEIMNQKDAEKLWNKIEPAFRYRPDSLQLSVKNLIDVTKSKFEDKPNIPSYYMFHLMSDILEKLKKAHESLNAPAFLRTFDNAVYVFLKLISDLDNIIKSDQTAKNTVKFLEEAKKTVMTQLDLIQKTAKEWKEYISSLETLIKRTRDIVKGCVEAEKDQSIFDHMAAS